MAEYREKTTGAGFDLGVGNQRTDEVRLGYDVADVRIRRRVGEADQPEAVGGDHYATLRWVHDSQTSPVIPTRGVYSTATLRYYFDTPEIKTSDGAIDRKDFPQAEARAWWFTRIKENHRAFVTGAFGTTFDQDPGVHAFRLGGPMKLGALNNDEIVGEHYLYLAGGLLYRWFRLPDVLGGNAYLGAWYENGSAFEDWDSNKKYLANVSGGTVVETLLGPFFLGGSVSLNDGSARFYVSLQPFVF
jgi:NTE family protein